jgi:hypothetical protein
MSTSLYLARNAVSEEFLCAVARAFFLPPDTELVFKMLIHVVFGDFI